VLVAVLILLLQKQDAKKIKKVPMSGSIWLQNMLQTSSPMELAHSER
jgi:hypothetical protein